MKGPREIERVNRLTLDSACIEHYQALVTAVMERLTGEMAASVPSTMSSFLPASVGDAWCTALDAVVTATSLSTLWGVGAVADTRSKRERQRARRSISLPSLSMPAVDMLVSNAASDVSNVVRLYGAMCLSTKKVQRECSSYLNALGTALETALQPVLSAYLTSVRGGRDSVKEEETGLCALRSGLILRALSQGLVGAGVFKLHRADDDVSPSHSDELPLEALLLSEIGERVVEGVVKHQHLCVSEVKQRLSSTLAGMVRHRLCRAEPTSVSTVSTVGVAVRDCLVQMGVFCCGVRYVLRDLSDLVGEESADEAGERERERGDMAVVGRLLSGDISLFEYMQACSPADTASLLPSPLALPASASMDTSAT
ncbi:hypothetical protein KIPB_008458, partial [Kipferlia bialata]|eukprot:g8458.t1